MKLNPMNSSVPRSGWRRWLNCLPVGKSHGHETYRHRRNRAKAQSALKAGAWQVINYREENLVERLKEITGGKKVRVVYDSVGRDTGNGRWIACNAAA